MNTGVRISLFMMVIFFYNLNGQEKEISFDLNGQVIGWTNLNFTGYLKNQTGLRVIPELSTAYALGSDWDLDAEVSLNAFGTGTFSERATAFDGRVKPYRLWLRLSTGRFESRLGLQKINFGSASILRPLMWFDELDPRDPLQLTDGVYGFLLRYYFLNNANTWFWILYGNEERRGWDTYSSDPELPETGGRLQFPVGPGELAVSFHHRTVEGGVINLPGQERTISYGSFHQDRVAVDGKWDAGVGIWMENSLKKNQISIIPGQKWTNQLTLGSDYTFGVGNGLNLSIEHLLWTFSEEFLKRTTNVNFSAFSANYPLGLIDRISAIFYYDWRDNNFYRIANWSRQYDNVIFYIMAYWNPDIFKVFPGEEAGNLFSGKGFQFMISYNY